MNEDRRKELLWRLYHPQMPDPFISDDYGVLYRDIPPRRTLREKVAALGWYGRYIRAQRRAERDAAARARD